MTKKVIAITQNKVAYLPSNSEHSLITYGLQCCIGIVLRGSLGFGLMHFTTHTDPVIQAMNKLALNSSI